jgi:hypothetical protein
MTSDLKNHVHAKFGSYFTSKIMTMIADLDSCIDDPECHNVGVWINLGGDRIRWYMVIREGVYSEDFIRESMYDNDGDKIYKLFRVPNWEILYGRIERDFKLSDDHRFVKEYRYFRTDNIYSLCSEIQKGFGYLPERC